MANEEHLAMLRQGAEVWNQWRMEHLHIRPDLSNADLSGIKLSEAILYEANFLRADLSGADLTLVDLNKADFWETNLSGANFSRAQIMTASFMFADLSGADLSNVWLGRTIFGGVDLSQVKGLETVRHLAPSTIGIDTVYRSRGKIPEIFLKSAGVSDAFIPFMHSLVASGQPIQFYSCFISYSTLNQAFADQIYNDLQGKGVQCWFAPEDLKTGDELRPTFDQAIRVRDKLLLVLSQESINSRWVKREVEQALDEEERRQKNGGKDWHVLFPVRLDNSVFDIEAGWATDVKRRHIGDFRDWKDHDAYQKVFNRLPRDLQAEAAP